MISARNVQGTFGVETIIDIQFAIFTCINQLGQRFDTRRLRVPQGLLLGHGIRKKQRATQAIAA